MSGSNDSRYDIRWKDIKRIWNPPAPSDEKTDQDTTQGPGSGSAEAKQSTFQWDDRAKSFEDDEEFLGLTPDDNEQGQTQQTTFGGPIYGEPQNTTNPTVPTEPSNPHQFRQGSHRRHRPTNGSRSANLTTLSRSNTVNSTMSVVQSPQRSVDSTMISPQVSGHYDERGLFVPGPSPVTYMTSVAVPYVLPNAGGYSQVPGAYSPYGPSYYPSYPSYPPSTQGN
ncbi:hypothetical protein M231_06962 [Tremella mesenterica]|uniref:Uncharacterized protein n=1 Tax=Tremella mesenterica TaxID=5217 RepID=A0A4Q1BD47_TREME|nr:hypothetical protein M231_06962 [Tremella mesenterica]